MNCRNALARATVGVALLFGTGCYKVTVVDDQAAPAEDPAHEEWTNFFLFGLVGSEEFDTRTYCHGAANKVRTGGNVGTVIVSSLTIGIYTPRKVYVYCAPKAPGGAP